MNEVAANDKFLRQWIYLCEDKLERVKKMSPVKVPSNENVEMKTSPSENQFSEESKVKESTNEEASKTREVDQPKTEVSTERNVPLPSRYRKKLSRVNLAINHYQFKNCRKIAN